MRNINVILLVSLCAFLTSCFDDVVYQSSFCETKEPVSRKTLKKILKEYRAEFADQDLGVIEFSKFQNASTNKSSKADQMRIEVSLDQNETMTTQFMQAYLCQSENRTFLEVIIDYIPEMDATEQFYFEPNPNGTEYQLFEITNTKDKDQLNLKMFFLSHAGIEVLSESNKIKELLDNPDFKQTEKENSSTIHLGKLRDPVTVHQELLKIYDRHSIRGAELTLEVVK